MVLKGNNILGNLIEALDSTSQALKKLSLFEASLATLKKDPWKDNSIISDPLNKFLPKNENLPNIPKGLMFEVVASRSTVKAYFLRGLR